jgi:hypothetical protein
MENIKDMVIEIRNGIKEDDFNETMGETKVNLEPEPIKIEYDTFNFNDLLDSDEDNDTFNYDDLF